MRIYTLYIFSSVYIKYMQDTYYPLDPCAEKIVVKRVIKFTITNLNITLFNQATMMAMLYDDDVMIDGLFLTLTGSEYLDWNSDDEYLVSWVERQIRIQYNKD